MQCKVWQIEYKFGCWKESDFDENLYWEQKSESLQHPTLPNIILISTTLTEHYTITKQKLFFRKMHKSEW